MQPILRHLQCGHHAHLHAFLKSTAKTLWLAPLPNADLARAGMLEPWTTGQEQQGVLPDIQIIPVMRTIAFPVAH